jgi:hypothetical protein
MYGFRVTVSPGSLAHQRVWWCEKNDSLEPTEGCCRVLAVLGSQTYDLATTCAPLRKAPIIVVCVPGFAGIY